MYAQVSSITLQPGKVDEWLAITRDAILPAAQERPGFISAFILVDRENNTGIGISLWETEADVDAVASSGFYQEQVAKVAGCLVGTAERQVLGGGHRRSPLNAPLPAQRKRLAGEVWRL